MHQRGGAYRAWKRCSQIFGIIYNFPKREATSQMLIHLNQLLITPLARALKVLGKDAPKFLGSSFYHGNGSVKQSRAIYNFPKREAMLMAMSYSYELQAQIFDAWEAGVTFDV